MAENTKIRINRFFTDNGVMSRREADRVIQEHRVRINGRTAVLGDQVGPEDSVTFDGKKIQTGKKKPVIIAYNKPAGVECTTDRRVKNNIIDAVKYPERVFHIGRLDKESEGLILLTNIGDVVNKILRARFYHEKEYVVELSGPITEKGIATLAKGVQLDDGMTRPCKVFRLGTQRIRIILTEGRNRQIRRMIEHLDLSVTKLRRVRIINILLGRLASGHWRKLTKPELEDLMDRLSFVDPEFDE